MEEVYCTGWLLQVDKRLVAGGVPTVPRAAMPTATKLFSAQSKAPFLGDKKQPSVGRGTPPPVPPNKPVVPPKKDTILCRRGDTSMTADDTKSSPQVKSKAGEQTQVGSTDDPAPDLELDLHQLTIS